LRKACRNITAGLKAKPQTTPTTASVQAVKGLEMREFIPLFIT